MPRDETIGQRAAQLRLGRLPGYVRQPDLARRSGEDGHTYKKGWEVRFTARTEEEITEIRDLVIAAGFAPARPFFKGHQLIQPVYGMAAVQAYLAAREAAEDPGFPHQGAAFPQQRAASADRGPAFPEQSAAIPRPQNRREAGPTAAAASAAAAAQRANQTAEPPVSAPAAGRMS